MGGSWDGSGEEKNGGEEGDEKPHGGDEEKWVLYDDMR